MICEEESLTVSAEGFQAYDPLENNDAYQREVVYSSDEYLNRNIYVNVCERPWSLCDRGSCLTEASQTTN